MESKQYSFKIQTELKQNAEKLFSQFGMSLSLALNLFLSQAVRTQSIPFVIRLDSKLQCEAKEPDEDPYECVNSIFDNLKK